MLLTLPLLAAACGLDEGIFADEYTQALCQHELACGDQAELTFDGILTADDCYTVRIADVGAWGAGCRYKPSDAEVCLADMQSLVCPAGDGLLADRPLSCETVYFDCPTTQPRTPTDDEPEADPVPADSDAE